MTSKDLALTKYVPPSWAAIYSVSFDYLVEDRFVPSILKCLVVLPEPGSDELRETQRKIIYPPPRTSTSYEYNFRIPWGSGSILISNLCDEFNYFGYNHGYDWRLFTKK